LEIGAPYTFLIPILLGIVLFALNVKRICVDFVLIYQKLAPEKLRLSCVFEPSCSEYMILAVNKYGFLKGVIKGVRRLLRCHPPNGGVDYP
jgi:putative membrane protein insertion efficiency factor